MILAEKALLLKEMGAKIKKLRRKRQIEVKGFASTLKITPQAVSKIERGKVDLNVSRIIEIAGLLKVTPQEIFQLEWFFVKEKLLSQ